ncbi:hypothetical protein ACFP2T_47280 [Plantactinospora solaniradicis]|uniref:Uncharacterized protein n=1 Tax=Plantactinospora solaniradicis TaxID=1723736 RepID=A0ABW1KPK6_9ACTN
MNDWATLLAPDTVRPVILRQATPPAAEQVRRDPYAVLDDTDLTAEQKISVLRGYLIHTYEQGGQDRTSAARRVGVTTQEQADDAVIDWAMWATSGRLLPNRSDVDWAAVLATMPDDDAGCPTWCPGDCEQPRISGATFVERVHDLHIVDLTGGPAEFPAEQRAISVDLQSLSTGRSRLPNSARTAKIGCTGIGTTGRVRPRG